MRSASMRRGCSACPTATGRTTGADPDGIDLRAGPLRGRLAFPERVTTPGDLRRVLVDLAKEARGRAE